MSERRDRLRRSMRQAANDTRDVADEMAAKFGGCDDPMHPWGPQVFRDYVDFIDRVARPLVEADGDEAATQAAMALYRKQNPYGICVAMVMLWNRVQRAEAALTAPSPSSPEPLRSMALDIADLVDRHADAESKPGYNRWHCRCGEVIATGRKARAVAALRDHQATTVLAALSPRVAALVADAEQAGAVKALTEARERVLGPSEWLRDSATCRDIALRLDQQADDIERGAL